MLEQRITGLLLLAIVVANGIFIPEDLATWFFLPIGVYMLVSKRNLLEEE